KYLGLLHDRLQRFHNMASNCDSTHSLRERFNKALKNSLPLPNPSTPSFDIPFISIGQILSAISQLVPKRNMTISAPKCTVLHLGRLKTRSQYILNGSIITPKKIVRDLGIFFSDNLHFEHHIN
ncbi:hypothetical protein PENTCL1PPCAC_20356, partial [Pristionchus entomophagus]